MGKIIFTDRSRIVTFQECPRKRFLNYHLNGKGIERRQVALPLVSGIAVHQALEGLMTGVDVTIAVEGAVATYRETVAARGLQHGITPDGWFLDEQCWLLECVMRAWHKHRLPKILEEYEVVNVEQEFPHTLTEGVVQNARLDALLRHKETRGLEVLEFKTVSMPSYDWQQQWERNVQILANARAVEQHYGERCEGIKIEGLVIGQRKIDSAKNSPFNGKKLRNSPYTYAYRSKDDWGNPVYERGYQAGKAWVKVATYYEPLIPEKWVGDFTDQELDELFIPVPSLRPVPRLTESWRKQTVAQELRVHSALDKYEELLADGEEEMAQDVLDSYFPQHVGACKKYGSACAFEDACFDEGIGDDPIGSGLYKERTPHHDEEE